jgi:hypothetical protein
VTTSSSAGGSTGPAKAPVGSDPSRGERIHVRRGGGLRRHSRPVGHRPGPGVRPHGRGAGRPHARPVRRPDGPRRRGRHGRGRPRRSPRRWTAAGVRSQPRDAERRFVRPGQGGGGGGERPARGRRPRRRRGGGLLVHASARPGRRPGGGSAGMPAGLPRAGQRVCRRRRPPGQGRRRVCRPGGRLDAAALVPRDAVSWRDPPVLGGRDGHRGPPGRSRRDELVAWRMGMAQVAPFLATLDLAGRRRVAARARELLGDAPPPLRRSLVVFAGVV